ncbi:MAG TPA: hypothetical protein VF463_03700 [Sphingobium sp.]
MGAATFAAFGDTVLRSAGLAAPGRSVTKFDVAMRWVQVVFTEHDPGGWDRLTVHLIKLAYEVLRSYTV